MYKGYTKTQDYFRKINTIIPITIPSTTANVVDVIASTDGYGDNFDITITASTGTLFITNTTAVSVTNGYTLTEGDTVNIKVQSVMSIVGGTTTAAYSAIIWE